MVAEKTEIRSRECKSTLNLWWCATKEWMGAVRKDAQMQQEKYPQPEEENKNAVVTFA